MRRVVVVVTAAVMLLGGCAAPGADPGSPDEVSTPTPTADADLGPVVRVGATCDDFADLATVSGLLTGASDVRLVPAPAGAIWPLVQQQYGSLSCEWGPGGVSSTAQQVRVVVAPEVTDAQWDQIVALASGSPGVVHGGFSGDAYSNCRAIPDGRYCTLDDRIDGWYLQVSIVSTQPAAEGETRTWGNPFLQHAVDPVVPLPAPVERWQPTTSVPAPSSWASLMSDGSLASELGYDTVDVAFVAPNSQSQASWIAGDATGYQVAYLQGITADAAQNFNVEVLPGGSWGWETASVGGTPVDDVGEGAVSFVTADRTTIVFRVGGDLAAATAEAQMAPPGADLIAVATAAARHLAAALS